MATLTPQTRTRSYDPEQTREALVEAAVELFGERGFHATSVQELVSAAKVTKGAFYHHFDSKEEVLHVVHDAFIDAHLERQRRILARPGTAHAHLYTLMHLAVSVIARYRPFVAVFLQERRALSGERHQDVLRKRDEAMDSFRTTARRGVAAGEFRADVDPDIAAFGAVGMCDWTYQWLSPAGRLSVDEVARTFALIFLRGVSAQPEDVERLVEDAVLEET
jgi:AcrR family transcriptional regulator